MSFYIKLIAGALILLLSALPAHAQSKKRGTPDQAIAMVKRVKQMFYREGPEKTFKAVNARATGFRKADLYPFIVHVDGWMAAHFLVSLRGLKFNENLDRNGKVIFKQFMKVVRSPRKKGWANYAYFNPVTKKIGDKSAYIEMLDNEFFVAVGVYGKVENVAYNSR